MWPFGRGVTSENDLRRLNLVVEDVESLKRRMEALVVDLDEFYAKANKARQRVVKEDRDAARVAGAGSGGAVGVGEVPREVLKAQLRARLRHGA
jgi:hypothetical protein